MKLSNTESLFHAELDQLLFRCDRFLSRIEEYEFKGVTIPAHIIDKSIASIFYCNDIKSLESMLEHAKLLSDFSNEMELISRWAIQNPRMIRFLPTLATEIHRENSFEKSGLELVPAKSIDGIVDAAQLGQWVAGQDPRNVPISNHPRNKYVDSSSDELLSRNELLNSKIEIQPDGSLQIVNNNNTYNVYNIHLHSKIHPWIIKSNENLSKLFYNSNKSMAITYREARLIQVLNFIETGIISVTTHPIEFLKRLGIALTSRFKSTKK
jgi:hypothetical protein